MDKLKIGDFVIIKMHAFFEKCEVVSKEKNTLTLNNGIKFTNKTLVSLNSKAIIVPYTDEEYGRLQAYYEVPRMLKELTNTVMKNRDKAEMMSMLFGKLKRIINRIEK